jgi:hypothetical protein
MTEVEGDTKTNFSQSHDALGVASVSVDVDYQS